MQGYLWNKFVVTVELIDDKQEGFRTQQYVGQIFTLKQLGEKAWEKKKRVYVDFVDFEKVYDRVNRKAIWQILRMHDVGGKQTFLRVRC